MPAFTVESIMAELTGMENPKRRAVNERHGDDHGVGLDRQPEQRGAKGEGHAQLFWYNQFIIATCRQQAKFGTISTHTEKYFYRWADPYPRTVEDLDHGAGSPNDQQRLVAGMLDRQNLLDLIRTFTLFSVTDSGQTIKIVGRYQQFRAVKLAVKRLLEGKTPRQRSGIIWHTQGSGKSLTMMFMVRELYRHSRLAHWKVVFVTDRTQLETQLTETSQAIGFTVKVADSIRKLKELLASTSSDLVMAMIHKFREADLEASFPELNTSPNILVLTDEAHRSQYKLLAANLDRAIPNASKIGYTGTPIDKTERVFGDYIDKYTMRQSIADGVTLEIVYEGRTHNAELDDATATDTAFQDVFSDYKLDERLEKARQRLLEVRGRRVPPGRDDKQLASWNALAIRGLAIAGSALERPDLVVAAARRVGVHVLPVAGDDDQHDRGHGQPDPGRHRVRGEARDRQNQEDLLRCIGHRRQRIGGEHRKRDPLR